MPPRTANSPRFSTSSTRAYAAAASASTTAPRSAFCPLRSATGTRSPRPCTCGWSTERTGATTTFTGPAVGSSALGCASRRRTARRRPTVSERGESRSCGRVSQAGYSATASSGSRDRSAAARSSASRPVAVTARTVRPARAASAPMAKARAAGGPTMSTCGRVPPAAAFTASERAGSPTTTSSRPFRLMKAFRPQLLAYWLAGTTVNTTRTARHVERAGVSQRTTPHRHTRPRPTGNPVGRGLHQYVS